MKEKYNGVDKKKVSRLRNSKEVERGEKKGF